MYLNPNPNPSTADSTKVWTQQSFFFLFLENLYFFDLRNLIFDHTKQLYEKENPTLYFKKTSEEVQINIWLKLVMERPN
jgi:hypothetical protein